MFNTSSFRLFILVIGAVVGIGLAVAAGLPGGDAETRGRGKLQDGAAGSRVSKIFRVYLDSAGSDSNDGLTPMKAVASLARAQQVIATNRPQTDVEVRVKQGVYVAAPLKWRTFIPHRTISFMPIDYEYGEGNDGFAGRPIFRGDGTAGYWIKAFWPRGHPGGATLLRFYFLQVEGYSAGALAFDGGTAPDYQRRIVSPRSAGANGNIIYGMVFRWLGSKYVPAGTGYGAINLRNSRGNLIQHNEFEHVENGKSRGRVGSVHGVYIAHHSQSNIIRDNRFLFISGDPVRTRDSSSGNQIFDNIFVRSGYQAHYSDWFLQDARRPWARECASYGNMLYGNKFISGYAGPVAAWRVAPGDIDYAGGSGCDRRDEKRIKSWGNTSE